MALVYVFGRIGVMIDSPYAIQLFLVLIGIGWTNFVTRRAVGDYAGRKTGVMANTLPASVWSKFLLAWSVSVGGIVALALVCVVVNSLAAALGWMHLTWSVGLKEPLGVMCILSSVVMLVTLSIDRRGGFRRQVLWAVAVVAAATVLIIKLPGWVGIPGGTEFPFFYDFGVWVYGSEGGSIFQTVSWATGWWHGAISDAVTFSIPVVFWVAGLFKLKEIEL